MLEPLGILEKRSNQHCRQIRQGLNMGFRDERASVANSTVFFSPALDMRSFG
jgi:hypothetical protein